MSGICGIVALGGKAPALADIAALTAELERRGPDGTHHWFDGPVALGHTLLATTHEAQVEQLPLTDPASGCTITADVRLDNREELIAAVGLERDHRVIGDGELILRAYLLWGEDCPKHLLGDFAFAIWDPRSQQLFCARDHMGMRQFNYCHLPGEVFVFSTEDTGVLAHPAVPRELDEGRIADFIADREDFDFTATFFESVKRLPPAHWLSVNARSCEYHRYWTLEPGPSLQLETEQAYVDALMEVFTKAVRSRLRASGPVAAMLSGGLDSSAVTAVAARILADSGRGPLNSISAVSPETEQCPETQAIHSALSIAGLHPTFVSLADLDGMKEPLIAELNASRNPFEVNGTMLRSIYLTARSMGVNVVLDGGAGDVILTSNNRIAALLAKRQLKLAVGEVIGQRHFWKPRRPLRFMAGRFLAAAWVAFVPIAVRSAWRDVRHFRPLSGAAPGFAMRIGFAKRRRTADEHVSMKITSEKGRRAQAMLHPNLASGRERFDQLAGSFAVESRDPFMDVRVIEFCLSLPPEQLQAGGWPKLILRRAMEGWLPDGLAWRRGKEHLGWDFTKALLARWDNWQDSMCALDSPLRRYVAVRALRNLRDKQNDQPTGFTMQFFALDRFLRRYDGRA